MNKHEGERQDSFQEIWTREVGGAASLEEDWGEANHQP